MSAPLLPQDRYIAELLGLSEEEMRWYKAEVQRRAAEGPQPAVVAGTGAEVALALAIVNLVIGVGLTVVSALLVPRPQAENRGRLTTRQRQGDTLQIPSSFAPTYGFEAVQDIAPLGDPIPLIYTKREFINGNWFGGVRVNTPLLWSQIWSLGGSQLLRAIFLVSEGEIETIQPFSFAIGNNTLGAYSFNSDLQRIAVYTLRDGGRLAVGNYLAGAKNDIGAQGIYASDIYQVDTGNNQIEPLFCGAYKPSTSTSFGLYAPIANGLGYRINPRIRPLRQLQANGDEYDATDDAQAVAEAWKYKYCYSGKSGIISTSKGSTPNTIVALSVNDTFEYMLSAKSDGVRSGLKNPSICVNQLNSDNKKGSQDGSESLVAVGQAVAGRQKQYDSNLQEGELYKVGSCLAILVSRSPIFISEADYSLDAIQEGDAVEGDPGKPGESAMYTFRVVRAGSVGVAGITNVDTRFFDVPAVNKLYPARSGPNRASKPWLYNTVGTNYNAGNIGLRYYTASAFPQIFRCALGSVSLNRSTRYFEIGIRSTVAMQLQGICNFADVPSEITTFILGVVIALDPVGTYNTPVVNGTFVRTLNSATGTGLQLTYNVSGGIITSVFITSGGSKYKVGQTVSTTLPLQNGGTTTLTYTITQTDSVEQPPQDVPGYRAINFKAADALDGESIEDNLTNAIFSSGTITAPEKRYSFFRVGVRADPSVSTTFVDVSNVVFCVASAKETPVFNFLRFKMNGEANWEVRLEPVSSWEIRNSTFSLVLLESDPSAKFDRIEIGFSAGVVSTKGMFLTGSSASELFDIQGLQPKQEIGISWTEGDYASQTDGTYIDRYARAAEFFMYDEISTSCASGPEHEITYVNVAQPNETIPQYDNLCLVGINVRASREWSQFSQFSTYVTGGIKVKRLLGGFEATHLFPEILYDFMLNKRYGIGNEISPEQIDVASFTAAAQFCQDNRFFYDGPKLNNTNWRQWAADVAATHMLLLIERGGVFFLELAIPEKPEIRGLFTAGNAISMELSTVEAEQRQPFSVSVKFREERYGADLSSSPDPSFGLFPEPQERLLYHKEWGPGPIESIDVSEYCTSANHAVKAARYVIGARRLSDHTVKITTTYEALTSSLAPGDFIKVALDYTHYNEFNNGAVTETGQLVSSAALSNGSYEIVYWTGEQAAEVQEGTLVVSNNGATATPTGIVFTIKSSEILTRTYRIDSIQPSDEGYEIDAVHTPLLEDGTLQLYAEWSDPSFWVTA